MKRKKFRSHGHNTYMRRLHFCMPSSVALIPEICFDIDIDILIFKNFDIDIDNIKLIKLTLILILILIFDI